MIISAACRATVNGEENIFKIHRHGDFFLWMKQLHCDYDKSKVESGFIDWNMQEERFVSREEAYQIALREGQLSGPTDTPGQLFSENLY